MTIIDQPSSFGRFRAMGAKLATYRSEEPFGHKKGHSNPEWPFMKC